MSRQSIAYAMEQSGFSTSELYDVLAANDRPEYRNYPVDQFVDDTLGNAPNITGGNKNIREHAETERKLMIRDIVNKASTARANADNPISMLEISQNAQKEINNILSATFIPRGQTKPIRPDDN